MKIRDKNLREAFSKIKRDMEEIRQVQRSQAEAFSMKLESRTGDLRQRLESILSEIRTGLAEAVQKTEKDVERISKAAQESLEAGPDIAHLRQAMSAMKDEIENLRHMLDSSGKRLDLVSNKLQEFENLSVDVEDVENDFVSRKAFEEHMDFIYPLVGVEKKVKNLKKEYDRIDSRLQDIENERYAFASKETAERIQGDIADLKSNLAVKDDLIGMNSRIDSMEDWLAKQLEKSGNDIKKMEKDMVDVYRLKRSFVTKEQFSDMRKELRLLVQGLKEIQKLKEKIGSVKKVAKKAQLKKKAATKKLVGKKTAIKKQVKKAPARIKTGKKKPVNKASAKSPVPRKAPIKSSPARSDFTKKKPGARGMLGSVVDFFIEDDVRK